MASLGRMAWFRGREGGEGRVLVGVMSLDSRSLAALLMAPVAWSVSCAD